MVRQRPTSDADIRGRKVGRANPADHDPQACATTSCVTRCATCDQATDRYATPPPHKPKANRPDQGGMIATNFKPLTSTVPSRWEKMRAGKNREVAA